MKTYEVAFTFTDCTEVTAESDEEALELAQTVFNESGYNVRGELDIIHVSEADDGINN